MQAILFKYIALILSLAALVFYVNHLTNRAVKAEAALSASKTLADEKAKEDERRAKEAAAQEEVSAKKHADESLAILNNFNKVINQKGAENEKLNLKLADSAAVTEQLRKSIEKLVAGMPQGDNGQQPAQIGTDCHPTDFRQSDEYKIIEQGIALTTSQYNRCAELLQENCLRTGCVEKSDDK